MPDDECACGLKYKTGGQVVAAVQMILGLSLIITGFATIDYGCWSYTYDDMDKYYDCLNENWVSWAVTFGGFFCMTAASLLLYGVNKTRPNGLTVYVVLAGCSAFNYSFAAVLAICYEMQAIFVVLLFVTSLWFGYTVVFVFKYRTIMILQLPRTRIILATPYVSGGQYLGAPAQVVISPGVQPGVYPAPYSSAPPAYPGNANPAYPYPSNFSQPPLYNAYDQPPPIAPPNQAGPLHPKSNVDPPTYNA